jgi:hypothetical protein
MPIRLTLIFAAVALLGCAKTAHGGKTATPEAGLPPLAAPTPAAPAAKAIEDHEPAVTAQLREVLQKIADGSIGQSYFTDRAIASLFPDLIKGYTERLGALGGMSGLELLSRTVDGENRVYRYRVLGPNGKLIMAVVYGKSARINQFALSAE